MGHSTMRIAGAFVFAAMLGGPIFSGPAGAQTASDAKPADAAKTPSKAELGEMLKKCSDEADAKGLTVQKGKAEARKSYRRACMLKNGVSPRKK